jgi:hypothetical protein
LFKLKLNLSSLKVVFSLLSTTSYLGEYEHNYDNLDSNNTKP